jgi:hypothetical protein
LIIIDNVDTEEGVKKIARRIFRLRHGVVLVTSRFGYWPNGFLYLELDVLSNDAAIEYLMEATADHRLKIGSEPLDAADRDWAKSIVNSMGNLALGLAQAAALINKRRMSFKDYQTLWNTNRDRLLNDSYFDPNKIGYPRQLGTTWLTTYQALSTHSKLVFDILCWLGPYPVPESLITKQ